MSIERLSPPAQAEPAASAPALLAAIEPLAKYLASPEGQQRPDWDWLHSTAGTEPRLRWGDLRRIVAAAKGDHSSPDTARTGGEFPPSSAAGPFVCGHCVSTHATPCVTNGCACACRRDAPPPAEAGAVCAHDWVMAEGQPETTQCMRCGVMEKDLPPSPPPASAAPPVAHLCAPDGFSVCGGRKSSERLTVNRADVTCAACLATSTAPPARPSVDTLQAQIDEARDEAIAFRKALRGAYDAAFAEWSKVVETWNSNAPRQDAYNVTANVIMAIDAIVKRTNAEVAKLDPAAAPREGKP